MLQEFLKNVELLFMGRVPMVLVYYLCPLQAYDAKKAEWLCSERGYKSDFGPNAKLITVLQGFNVFLYVTNPGRLITQLRGFPLVAASDLNKQGRPVSMVKFGQHIEVGVRPLIPASAAEISADVEAAFDSTHEPPHELSLDELFDVDDGGDPPSLADHPIDTTLGGMGELSDITSVRRTLGQDFSGGDEISAFDNPPGTQPVIDLSAIGVSHEDPAASVEVELESLVGENGGSRPGD